jgi:hypothetical protein
MGLDLVGDWRDSRLMEGEVEGRAEAEAKAEAKAELVVEVEDASDGSPHYIAALVACVSGADGSPPAGRRAKLMHTVIGGQVGSAAMASSNYCQGYLCSLTLAPDGSSAGAREGSQDVSPIVGGPCKVLCYREKKSAAGCRRTWRGAGGECQPPHHVHRVSDVVANHFRTPGPCNHRPAIVTLPVG